MTENIAIFDNEQGVLDAIRMLREAGAEQDDIRVILNNREEAPLLASEQHIRIEELYELQSARDDDEEGTWVVTPGFLPGGTTTAGTGRVDAALIGGIDPDPPGNAELLREIGIPGKSAGKCAKAIENGRYVVVTDTEVGINAEAVLSRAGAADVIGWTDE